MKSSPTTPYSVATPVDETDVQRQIHELLHKQAVFEKQNEVFRAATQASADQTEAVLNALPAQIALIDPLSRIVVDNDKWIGFGLNYLQVCESATGECAEESLAIAIDLRSVLSGHLPPFTREYPCHRPHPQRWFRLMVTLISGSQCAGAVVMHVDFTEREMPARWLREEQARLTGLIDSAMDAIVTVDATQTIARLIPARFEARHEENVKAFPPHHEHHPPTENPPRRQPPHCPLRRRPAPG